MRCRGLLVTGLLVLLAPLPALGQGSVAVGADARVEPVLEAISGERLRGIVEKLASFHTRNTLSAANDAARGIGAARQWILQEMQSYSPRLQVSFDRHTIPARGRITRDVELVNVMAVLPGRSERRVYVTGHFDSLAFPEGETPGIETNDNYAPGANDDGSGTAVVMELARVIATSGLEFDATLVFMPLAGEEQGLVGARAHAQAAREQGLRIDAVFNNDIVGNTVGGSGVVDGSSVRVFSEGPEDSPSWQLARFIRRQAALYVPGHEVRLIAREDRFGRGGDHTAFNQNGFAAVRVTESKENYDRQHTTRDTPDGVDARYLAQNARVNAAGVLTVALAPAAPVIADARGNPRVDRRPSGYDARLRWDPSPGAVGYRVFWRRTWGPDWEHEVWVGDATEHVLEKLSIDDYTFGIAAVGPNGNESLVSAYVRPPRENVPVQTNR